ncbi:HAD family hydrolase [Saccharopolyspora shandongensis]|uniref:HAD family hydrolase n=1 Tax=Saccharopolyspora shandongensis TaxID=418495 RepID=UPI00341ADCEF
MTDHRDSCVVFDIDDTLYLERDYVRSGFAAIERLHGLGGFAEAAWQLFLDGVRGDTIDRALRVIGPDPDPALVRQLVSTYREHRPDIRLLPDALGWLEHHHAGTRLACVTDGALSSQRAKASALGLANWCPTIVMTAALGAEYGKPHVRAFQEVARVTSLPPQRYVYVADNPRKDFDGPHQLGWATIRIRRRGGLHAELATPSFVDHEVTDLHDLDSFLGQNR